MNSTTESNKALYRNFIEDIFNAGKVEKMNDYLAPTYQLRDAPPGTSGGPEGVASIVRMFRSAFPDLKISIEQQVAEGDLVTSRTTTRGTQRGAIFGVPASNRPVTVPGLTMVKVADGRITESTVKNDMIALLKQIGATTVP